MNDNELRQNLIEGYLKRMPDFQKIEWKFIKNKASLQDCFKVYQAVQILPRLLETLTKKNGENSFLLKDLSSNPLKVIGFSIFRTSSIFKFILNITILVIDGKF